MYKVEEIRKDFPMLSKSMQGHKLVFLDNSSTTFKPKVVIDAIETYYKDETANSHRGDYDLCYAMDVRIEQTRKNIASLINSNPNEIVFTTGTTFSLNLIAHAYVEKYLEEGDEIILSEVEHASNLLPWFDVAKKKKLVLKFVKIENGRISIDNFKAALTSKTKFVSLAQVSNVLGYKAPIKEIVDEAHKVGALVCVDAAQSAPHMSIDVADLNCDFLCFSGHKMCGPTGIGVMYGKYDLLQKMDSYFVGGGMNVKFDNSGNFVSLPAPMKFEAGTLNLAGICGLNAAITYLKTLGLDNIHAHEVEIKKYAIEKLSKLDNVEVYNPDSEAGIIDFNIKGIFAQDAATYLNSQGIACRSGQHCAKLLNNVTGVLATIRASIYLYTTKEEIDALCEAVKNGGNYLDAYFN